MLALLRSLWAFVLTFFGRKVLPARAAEEPPPLPRTEDPEPRPVVLPSNATAEKEQGLVPTKPDVRLTTAFSDQFFLDGVRMAHDLSGGKLSLTDFMSVWSYESGMDLRARNPKDTSQNAVAVGLFQWTHAGGAPADLDAWRLGTSDVEQLEAARVYYARHAPYTSIGHIYQATFRPATIATRGTSPDTPVATKGAGENYEDNWSLDYNRDGVITVQDLTDTAVAATKRMGSRWDEFVARTRWAEATLGLGPSIGIGVAGVAIMLIVAVAAYAYVKA